MKYKLCIIGFGVMGQAITQRIIEDGKLVPEEICVYDSLSDKISSFPHAVVAKNSAREAVDEADRVLIAVKPQHFPELATQADFTKVNTLISIMAGVKIAAVRKNTKSENGIVRVMPNTPCALGKGVCGVAFDSVCDDEKEFIINLLSSCGGVVQLEEKYFDAVTSVSGSGPAYVYMFAEGMIKGGMNGGLTYEQSKSLALDTIIGAAELAKKSDEPLSVLVDRVCSKGGTTIEAVETYRANNLVGIVSAGVDACRRKSVILSE